MTGRLARLLGPAVAVALAAAVLGWMPARQAAREADERVDSAERLVDELRWELDDLDPLRADQAELIAEREQLTAMIPDDDELAEVILILEDLAASTGTEVVDIVPASILGPFDDLRTPVGTSSIVIAVAMRGTYPDLLDLIGRFDDQPRLIMLDGAAVGTDEANGTLAIDLEIRVFTTKTLIEVEDGFSEDELAEDEEGLS